MKLSTTLEGEKMLASCAARDRLGATHEKNENTTQY